MTKAIICSALLISISTGFSKDILLECGISTRNAFNGWTISPYSAISDIIFTDETIDFYSDQGGDYTLSFVRKVESMKNYSFLDLTLQVNAIENCEINNIDVFVSHDGLSWSVVEHDRTNFKANIANPELQFQFVKIDVNVSFRSNGFLQFSYVKLEGENEWEMEEIETQPQVIENLFFVFCFNKCINVETKSEEPFDVVFSNTAGQIVYSETTVGSTRIETDLTDGVYVISIVQNGELLHSKKVIF